MTLKKFLPKICTLRGLEARIADFGLKGPGFDPPTNQKNFFYTSFLTILHTVLRQAPSLIENTLCISELYSVLNFVAN